MADYNSANTGVEIDAAVVATKEIMVFNQVYQGSPTDSGVPMSGVSTKPDGSKTGIYDVVWTAPGNGAPSASAMKHISRLYITDTAYSASGTSHTSVDQPNAVIYTQNADYNGTSFTAKEQMTGLSGSWQQEKQCWILELWRLEKISN